MYLGERNQCGGVMNHGSGNSGRKWIPRRQAATLLNTSYENVKRLQRVGHLRICRVDQNGVVLLDRSEVEALARKRLVAMKPAGELTACVFTMFEAGRSFASICIETKQDAETILRLWRQYKAGFDAVDDEAAARRERQARERAEREQREHDEQVRALEEELELRRRRAHGAREPSEGGDHDPDDDE